MKRFILPYALAIALIGIPLTSHAQFGTQGGMAGSGMGGYNPNDYESVAKALQSALDDLKRAEVDRERAHQRVKAGLDTSTELDRVEFNRRNAERLVRDLEEKLEELGFLRNLKKPIDLEFRQATLETAMKALSQASGVTVSAGKEVKSAKRLTIVGNHISLQQAMEAIAQQLDLMIDSQERRLTFRNWPSLMVNGNTQTFRNSTPWSNANLTSNTLQSRLYANNLVSPMGGVATGFPTALASPASRTARSPLQIQVTQNSQNEVIVTETGKTAQGKQGIWITVYRQVNGKLVQKSKGFHLLESKMGMALPSAPVPLLGNIPIIRNLFTKDEGSGN